MTGPSGPEDVPSTQHEASAAEHTDLQEQLIRELARKKLFATAWQPPRIGHFALLGQVGAGGMGSVYAAYDDRLERKVAIKLLHAAVEDHAQLLREARALARLTHPNVVAVHEVGDHAGEVFLAMEFVAGETLREVLQARVLRARTGRAGGLDWRAVVALFVQAGRGLAAAHAAGLIHRDFKPENVIAGDDGRVRVLDFGIVCPQGADAGAPATAALQDPTQRFVGTPAYMAPEQFLRQPATARSDQYSFCVALFEGLYRVRPFAGEDLAALVDAVLHATPAAPPRADVPGWLHAIVMRGLSRDPAARWPDMNTLLAELARDPMRTRRRWLLAATACALIGASTAATIAVRERQQDLCAGAGTLLRGVWDGPRRAEVRAALLATGASFAGATADAVERELDDYAARWVQGRVDACEATHVRGEQSPQILDRRMSCLDERRRGLAALVSLLARADPQIAETAVDATGALDGVEPCASPAWLAAELEPPRDEATGRQVEALRERLAAAQTLERSGQYAEGVTLARAAVDEAEALAYPPTIVEARLRLGALEVATGDLALAEADLSAAYWRALAIGHDHAALAASLELAYALAEVEKWPAAGLMLAHQAESWAERLGSPPEQQGAVLTMLALAEGARGDFRAARELHARVLAVQRGLHGDDHLTTAVALANFGTILRESGDVKAARDPHEQALVIRQRVLGPDHPDVARSLNSLALVAMDDGDLEGARELFTRSLAVYTRALGPGHIQLAQVHNNLGNLAQRTGDLPGARRELERALEVLEAHHGVDHFQVGQAVGNLGSVLRDLGESAAARQRLTRALQILAATAGEQNPNYGVVLDTLGSLDRDDGAPAQAAEYHRRALAVFEAAFGPAHLNVGVVLGHLGDAELDLGHPAEARRSHERALALLTAAVGEHDPSLLPSVVGLGEAALALGELATAQQHAVRAQGLATSRGADRLEVARALLLAARTARLRGAPRAEVDALLAAARVDLDPTLPAHARLLAALADPR